MPITALWKSPAKRLSPGDVVHSTWLVCLIILAGCNAPQQSVGNDLTNRCVKNVSIQSFDGTKLVADCYPGTGSTVMLIHGAFQSRLVWQKQVQSLAGKYQLVLFDLRGHGESERPRTIESYNGLHTPAQDVQAVINHFKLSEVVLVGWSFGTIVASDAVAYLGRDKVAGLVLVSGTAESATERNRQHFGSLMSEVGAMFHDDVEAESIAVERFVRDSYRLGEWDEALFQQVLDVNRQLSPSDRSLVVARPTQRYAEQINQSNIPVLLIHGEQDPVFKIDASLAAHSELNRSTFTVYAQTGHWPFVEQAERFNADLSTFVEAVIGENNSDH